MSEERFKGEVLTGHKEPAVEVPFDPELVWGISQKPIRPGRRGYAVRGSLNGFEFESCIVSRMNKFYLLVDDQPRRAAGVLVGDIVNVTLEPVSGEKPAEKAEAAEPEATEPEAVEIEAAEAEEPKPATKRKRSTKK